MLVLRMLVLLLLMLLLMPVRFRPAPRSPGPSVFITPKLAQSRRWHQRMAQRGGRTLLGLGVRVACCCIVWFGSSIAIICELRTRTPLTHASQG